MEHKTIYAGLGKTLKRISDGMDFGSEITLGYTYYIDGKKLDEPLWELPEHYEKSEIPLSELRLGMIFRTDKGNPYTITAFNENGTPIYGEGELEVEIPEGYWEQFEIQQVEEVEEEVEDTIEVGDETEIDGTIMKCIFIDNGVPQWTVVNE